MIGVILLMSVIAVVAIVAVHALAPDARCPKCNRFMSPRFFSTGLGPTVVTYECKECRA